MELYLYKEIYKYLGITFNEFLLKPRYEIELILKNISKFLDKKNKTTENIMKNISKENDKIIDSNSFLNIE